MITSRVDIEVRRAAELSPDCHEGRLEKPAGFKILEEGGDSDVELRDSGRRTAGDIEVHVPTTGNDFHDTDAALDQFPGKKTALTEAVFTVFCPI